MSGYFWSAYLIWTVVISLATFVAYGWDKRQATSGGWRTAESTLHVLSFAGGWPGALMGQRMFRHKTRKTVFNLILWTAVLLHAGLITGFLWWTLAGSHE